LVAETAHVWKASAIDGSTIIVIFHIVQDKLTPHWPCKPFITRCNGGTPRANTYPRRTCQSSVA